MARKIIETTTHLANEYGRWQLKASRTVQEVVEGRPDHAYEPRTNVKLLMADPGSSQSVKEHHFGIDDFLMLRNAVGDMENQLKNAGML